MGWASIVLVRGIAVLVGVLCFIWLLYAHGAHRATSSFGMWLLDGPVASRIAELEQQVASVSSISEQLKAELNASKGTITDLQRQLEGTAVAANTTLSNAQANASCLDQLPVLKLGVVLIATLARDREVKLAIHNIKTHFQGWDCIAFVFVSPQELPDQQLDQLSQVCAIQRLEGLSWGIWLKSIPAMLLRQYEYTTILVQDLYIPPEISISELVGLARKHNAAAISPSVMGARSGTTTFGRPSGSHLGEIQPEVEEVKYIELFLTIYRSDVWERVWNWMLPDPNLGWCVDVCSGHVAREFGLGPTLLAPSKVAYHLASNVPPINEAIEVDGLADELTHTWDKIVVEQVADAKSDFRMKGDFRMCRQHGCQP